MPKTDIQRELKVCKQDIPNMIMLLFWMNSTLYIIHRYQLKLLVSLHSMYDNKFRWGNKTLTKVSNPPPSKSTAALATGAAGGGGAAAGGAFRSMLRRSPIKLSPAGITDGWSATTVVAAVGLPAGASSVDPNLKLKSPYVF